MVAVVAAATWPAVARASGHELNALGGLIEGLGLLMGSIPWFVSSLLLMRRPTPATWFFGTGLAIGAAVIVGVFELPAYCVALAGVPGVLHQVKRIRASALNAQARKAAPEGGDTLPEGARENDEGKTAR